MAWILGIIIFILLGAYCVYQFRESKADADRYDLSSRNSSRHDN